MKDPIVEEVRRIRESQAAKYNYDMEALLAACREREKDHPERVVDLSKARKTG